jgi:hypothetical protein
MLWLGQAEISLEDDKDDIKFKVSCMGIDGF